jgi:ATP-dependent exoDNAse (exonuclease V) alpha subunit
VSGGVRQVYRQRDKTERRELAHLHDGRSDLYLAWARKNDRVSFGSDSEQLARLQAGWLPAVAEHGVASVLVVTRSNELRAEINAWARHEAAEGREARCYGSTDLSVGERVVLRQNDYDLRVRNGNEGFVAALHERYIDVKLDSGAMRRLPATYVAEHVEYGYAQPAHTAQGRTVERTFVIGATHHFTRNWTYVAMSRARGRSDLLAVDDEPRFDRLTARMQVRDDDAMAIESLSRGQRVERSRGLGLGR